LGNSKDFFWNATSVQSNVSGGSGDDTIIGGSALDIINGDGDYDTIYGMGTADALVGGEGIDSIYGGEGDDYLNGGTSSDYLYGEGGKIRSTAEAPTCTRTTRLTRPLLRQSRSISVLERRRTPFLPAVIRSKT
jgi:hypothetical protein